jgi:hypothetical protein
MGKYSTLRGKIPAFQEESSYQEKVNDEKLLILGSANDEDANVTRLASLFVAAKQTKDAYEDKISELNVRLEALSQMIVEHLEGEQIQKVELASGALIYLQDTPYPIVKDRDAVLDWIKKQKMQSLLTVHFQTLKAMTSERLVTGKPCIPGTEVFLKTQARVRNGKGSEE